MREVSGKSVQRRFEIVEGLPAIFFCEEDAICIADLHLGYESSLAGISLPSRQLQEVERKFELALKNCGGASKLIINGDLKHVFSEASRQEWAEVPMFLDFVLSFVREIILVRGNHDTFLGPLRRFKEVKVVNSLEIGDVLLIHGHNKDFIHIFEWAKARGIAEIVIAHEHPFLILGDRVGARVRVPCFLRGRFGRFRICVLPAFSPLAGGTAVNVAAKSEFLSPILRSDFVQIDEMEVLAVDESAGTLKFPALRKWKAFSLRL